MTFEEASAEKKAALVAAFGETDQIYVLTYDDIYALDAAHMSMTRTYASVKVFDADKKDQSAVEDFWLAFKGEDTQNAGVVEMYFNTDPEKLPALPTVPSTGYVVFYDTDGSVLAIIECVSPCKEEEVVTPPEIGENDIVDDYGNVYYENTSYFSDPEAAAAAGAKLYQVRSGIYFDQYKENECPILILEYSSADTEVEISLPSMTAFWQVMPYKYRDFITMNGNTMADTEGMLFDSEITDKVKIRMSEDVALNKDDIESNSKDSPAGLKVLFHKDMGNASPFVVIFCRLNLSE